MSVGNTWRVVETERQREDVPVVQSCKKIMSGEIPYWDRKFHPGTVLDARESRKTCMVSVTGFINENKYELESSGEWGASGIV